MSEIAGVRCAVCGRLNLPGILLCAGCGRALALTESVAEPSPIEPTSPRGWAPLPGPADRESFFRAQARHRRATWRLAAVCAVAAIITGIPLSVALTPVLYTLLVIFTKLVDIVLPVPAAVWDAYIWSGRVLIELVDSLDDSSTPGVSEGDVRRVPVSLVLTAALIWLAPGILFMLVLWLGLRRLFVHGGAGGVLLSLGAREPRLDDLEERQLVNVVEEMAIAAGLPVPGVMLLDSSVANAAVVGSSRNDAVVIVSRALLDDLDRDATQGVLANLVAAIGNGDLRGARSILAVFETFGLAGVILKAPVSGPARRTLWRFLRYAFGRHTPEQRASEARAVAGMLTQGMWESEGDDFDWINEEDAAPAQRRGLPLQLLLYFPFLGVVLFIATVLLDWPEELRRLALFGLVGLALLILWYQRRYALYSLQRGAKWARVMVMLPYYMAAMLPQIILMLIIPFMLEPMIALFWRRRRYLADATTVQLTRNPDGLARGLTGLVARGGMIPGGHWASPLFVVGPEAMQARELTEFQAEYRQRFDEEIRRRDPEGTVGGARRLMLGAQAIAAHQQAMSAEIIRQQSGDADEASIALPGTGPASREGSFSGGSDPILSFHPSLNRRLKKLRALGSTVQDVEMRGWAEASRKSRALGILVMIALIPLWLLVAALMIVALVLLLGLTLFFCAILMMIVYALLIVLVP